MSIFEKMVGWTRHSYECEEDNESTFINLEDVKCSVANIGISHPAHEIKFFSVRDW